MLTLAATALSACASESSGVGSTSAAGDPTAAARSAAQIDPAIQKIMDKPIYRHGEFGLLVVDPATGHTVTSPNPAHFFLPGSTTKLFTVSAAWDTFGSTQRTTTPLLTDGTVTGDTLTGNLILVAKGDLTMGGRLKPDGTITVTIAAGSHPWLSTLPVADPAAFARTAMIDALQRAGITVDAAATGPDPAPPAQDPTSAPVATLVSPPFQQEAQLILKVSHNLGADLMVCLLAVHAGSKDCQSGFAGIKAFDTKAGVDVTQAAVNPLNDTVLVTDRSMAGYPDIGGGHFDLFTVVFNDAQVSDSDQILSIAQDIAQIAALLQQDVAGATPTP
ncbi:MAG TPA: D-alanyl-D-alanine carboxypeptidase [Actinocrinis sp.]|nr:D-alanyl-D-alanine carboxypeptidase [Actinocrinis sp.]